MEHKVKIIAIGGGTASGKTMISKKLLELSKDIGTVSIITMDNYYKDRSEKTAKEREKINYDHPSSLDIDLLVEHIKLLKEGNNIEMPLYDFKTHTRSLNTMTVNSTKVIILEGILALHYKELMDYINVKIYVDTPDDIRFIRRLKRDITNRARTMDLVVNQYLETVRPMHEAFVLPSKANANIIIPEGGKNEVAIHIINNTIISLIK